MQAFVLMGVSGSGKSTVSIHAAAQLAWPYLEGDDFHPATNIEKMSEGVALSDQDRAPWLDALARAINDQSSPYVIVACSALTQFARQRLQQAVQRPISFIHLRASPEVLAQRLRQRHHFMKADLLASQLATLETPHPAIEINADDDIDAVTARVIASMCTLAGIGEPRC